MRTLTLYKIFFLGALIGSMTLVAKAQSVTGNYKPLGESMEESESPPDSLERPYFNTGLYPRQEPLGLKEVSLSGFYRFFGTYTRMKEDYLLNPIINDVSLEHNLFIGDDAQLPSLLINVSGRPSKRASWGFDVYAYQFMEGNIGQAYTGQVADSLLPSNQSPRLGTRLAPSLILNLGINLYGSYQTDIGTFNIRAGGIHWFAMSDLTFGAFQGYNRFTLFERNPWDPVEKDTDSRYEQYWREGEISQDTRWGNRAFKGIIVEGLELPGDLYIAGLYGKSEVNGGFTLTPDLSYGGKLKKDFKRGQFISVNSFNSGTFADSLALQRVGYNMLTTEFRKYIRGFRVQAELGGGRYFSPVDDAGWEEALQAKVLSPKILDKFQVELHAFRIDPTVINNIGVFLNSSVNQYVVNEIPAGQAGSNAVLQPTGSSIVPLGMMTNNRQGLNLNASFELGNLHGAVGLGTAAEIEALSSQISYGHAVNQLTRSRFWRFNFPQNVGPYNRYSVIFRDTYETLNLTDDSSGVVINKKYFNNLEAQLKYKTRFLNRDLYAFFLGRYASAQPEWSALIVTNEEAYLRTYSSELEMYYCLSEDVNISSYLGYERSIANYLTDIDEITRKPRNQVGYGLGFGMDVSLGRNARLYLRHRWFEFKDRSFELDHFRGEETVVEIRATF